MKKIRVFLFGMLMLLGVSTIALAEDNVKIKVDGAVLSDAQAVLKDGVTLLPVRSVGTALGGNVTWDSVTKTVVVEKDKTTVVAPVGEKYIIIDDKTKSISVPSQIIGGKTYIPLRAIGEALSCDINWVNTTKTVEITDKKVSEDKDLFQDSKNDVPYFLSDSIYLTEGETVPVPVVGGNWVHWSNGKIINCEWNYYNNEQVIMIKGLKKGSSSLKLYESDSRTGRIEGDYTEIRVYVVDESSPKYQEQKAERLLSGYDIAGNQADLVAREEALKEKMGLELLNVSERNYIKKDGVFIIPIESNVELTGLISLTVDKNAGLEAVLDEYGGKPAIFIKGSKLANTNVILRYFYDDGALDLFLNEQTEEPDLLKERDEARLITGKESAAWEIRINVVYESNNNFKKQEKERLENGISYDLYLSGQA